MDENLLRSNMIKMMKLFIEVNNIGVTPSQIDKMKKLIDRAIETTLKGSI